MTDRTTRPLSDAERTLVERYHNLIYRVMHDLHLDPDGATDLYGEAALGLIQAAQRYISDESMQQHRFATIAYRQIRNTLLRQRHKEHKIPEMVSLDEKLASGNTMYDILPNNNAADPSKTVMCKENISLLKSHAVRSCKAYHFPSPFHLRRMGAA